MKKFLTRRSGAIVVAVIVVLLSIYFGAYRSLNVAAREVADGFSDGVVCKDDANSSAYLHKSIRSQLINRAEAGTTLVSVANNFSEVGEETTALRAASNRLKDLLYNNGSPSELYAADAEMDKAFYALYNKMDPLPLDKTDRDNMIAADQEMSGAAGVIEKSGYNESVRAFDRNVLSIFPTNLFRKICFIQEPELYYSALIDMGDENE